MPDLSIVIPSRNEPFLSQTVADVLAHATRATDVIIVCDGAWPIDPIPQHPAVTVLHVPTSIGQRAATNLGMRVARAPLVMKLDAHCALAPGFDAALVAGAAELGPLVTQIPRQYNLHVFDWVCPCGARRYQGPTPGPCDCGARPWTIDLVWKPRLNRVSDAWGFDADLKFEYWGEWKDRHQTDRWLETLSCLGACWVMDRQRYWDLGGLDEGHGGWGQMGTEIGCKSWLSGGRMVTNRQTWYAHLFRTQEGFGFPYELSGAAQAFARTYSQQLWRGNRWPGQTLRLRDLLDRFWPVKGWTEADRDALPGGPPTKGLVYYSDNRGDPAILEACRTQIARVDLPTVAVTLAPIPFRTNVVLPLARGPLAMFRQILAGLEALDTDYAFLVEHDVLYAPEHFDFTPPRDDTFYYNEHVWKVDAATGRALHYRCNQTSGLCANRQLLIQHYRERIARVEAEGFKRRMGFEPGTRTIAQGGIDDRPFATWRSEVPNVDIRHAHNLTPSRWKKEEFRNQKYTDGWTEADAVPGWGVTKDRFADWLQGAVA